MKATNWKNGDWVIYRKPKRSSSPGSRAEAIHPDQHGENYSYIVEKYWVVKQIVPEGSLRLITRTGKEHIIAADDSRLRKPRWWERFILAPRFRAVESILLRNIDRGTVPLR